MKDKMFKKSKVKRSFKLNRRQKKEVAESCSISKAMNSNSLKYKEFIKLGGSNSGIYDISDKKTAAFVKKYGEFIPKKDIYKRHKDGTLVPVYKR